ncbi:cell surface glycoprotein related protein, partial [bacterium]
LELYGILQIPPTPTATATATNTATPTATALPPTATLLPSQTPPPAATQVPTVGVTAAVRVAPGGPGNLGVISIGILFSSAILAGAVILARRQSRSR